MFRTRILVFISVLLYGVASAAIPEWWIEYGLMTQEYADSQYENAVLIENYDAATVGQLKNMTTQASLYLDANGGSGEPIALLVAQFEQPDAKISPENMQALNVGQLKAVSKLFYDRLWDIER